MSSEQFITFNDLINSTFDNGTLHINNLQVIFKILVAQLKLEDVNVNFGDNNLKSGQVQIEQENNNVFGVKRNEKASNETDLVSPTIPKANELADILCKTKSSNPIVDMLDLLNITKRVEAVEITVHKIASVVDALLKKQPDNENLESLSEKEEKISQNLIDLSGENDNKVVVVEGTDSKASEVVVVEETDSKSSEVVVVEETDRKSSEVVVVEEIVVIESSKSPSHQSAVSEKSNKSVASINGPKSSSTSKIPPQPNFSAEDLKNMINQKIDAASSLISEKVSKIANSVCELQKMAMSHQETIDDLLFACESIDMKHNETAGEIKDFNSKIFCLKSDVKTLIEDSKQFKSELEEVNTKYEIMDKVKTNKSYVDELWRQKAFKSDLEFFVRRDEFDPLVDVLQLNFSLLTEHFDKLDANTKKSMACMKSLIDEKLEKRELEQFKNSTEKIFDEFVSEIVVLLHKLTKSSIGSAATKHLDPNLNCIACDTKLSMKNSAPSVPKLSKISQKFKYELQKIQVISAADASNENFRQVFCMEEKIQKPQKKNCEKKKLVNFPSSPCFIVAGDRQIQKSNPIKLLIKSEN